MDENSSVSNRSTLEVCHFALCAVGFFVGAAGIVLSCPCLALGGAFLLGVGLLYFAVLA